MNQEQKEQLIKEKDNQFAFLKEIRRDAWNDNFQLALAQFDLFKNISGLIIGLSAIGYFYGGVDSANHPDGTFLLLAFFLGLLALLLSISTNRESIQEHMEGNDDIVKDAETRANLNIQKIIEAIKLGDDQIYYNSVADQYKNMTKSIDSFKPEVDYFGELIIFLFYSALGFVIVSFFQDIDCILKGALIFGIPVLSFIMSHYRWATGINKILNKLFNRRSGNKS